MFFLRSIKKGELLYPGLSLVAESYGFKTNDETIMGFLKKEYLENAEDYDRKGLPINDDYELLYRRWKDYLNETLMYQPRRIRRSV